MDPQPSVPVHRRDAPDASYTVSQTLRACLRALQLAAWIEAMVIAHRVARPEGAGSWCWFVGRCVLFSLGAYVVVGVAAQIMRRRESGRTAGKGGEQKSDAPKEPAARDGFDVQAFESTASALLFHFGTPLWMWIFG